jgi:aquaporin Z
MIKRMVAEFAGTFWIVLGGCGTAVLAGEHVGFLGIALAFGLTVVTMAYAVGHISGGHFNPAVTFGLWLGRRFPGKQVGAYMVAQVVGAIAAAALLWAIASGLDGYSVSSDGLGSNGYGAHSPGGYGLVSGLVAELVLTLVFVFVIMGATDERAPKGLAPLAIGLTLALIHLVCIPVTGTSVNPARSIGPAIFQGGWALSQLWVFLVAPLVGGAGGGLLYHWLIDARKSSKA